MKKVLTYRGMTVKEMTKGDVGTETWKIGELVVFNRDKEKEYDGVGTLYEARELIDGLISDKEAQAPKVDPKKKSKKKSKKKVA